MFNSMKNVFGGFKGKTEEEILRLIEETETERKRYKHGSPYDKRCDAKIAVLLELAERLQLDIRS